MRNRITSELPGFAIADGQRPPDLHTMRAVFHYTAMALQGVQHYYCSARPHATDAQPIPTAMKPIKSLSRLTLATTLFPSSGCARLT